MTERLIRLPEVLALTGFGKSTIFKWSLEGKFPKQTKLSKKLSVWKLSEVMAFVESIGQNLNRQEIVEAVKGGVK
jgi:prophage regulatory protein